MKDDTKAVIAGRDPAQQSGAVNPAITRASTILAPTLSAFKAMSQTRAGDAVTYGVHGTPGTYALEEAVSALEGGGRTRLCGSGLLAVTAPLMALLDAGDHLLMTDAVYGPTRLFCDGALRRMGVETTYYDPLIGADIRDLIRPNTRAIYLESPGSLTFEVQDTPAIVAVAREAGVWTLLDNTWASPLYFKPLAHGVNVSIQALTKYVAGHSDLIMGAVTADADAYPRIQRAWRELGLCASPDDAFLAARGLRSLPTRLARHQKSGIAVAEWLLRQPEIDDVLHPGAPWDPGHALWRRDFSGAPSLFGFVLKPEFSSEAQLARMLDAMTLFHLGFSWGGFESLLIPTAPSAHRTATQWPQPAPDGETRRMGQAMRIHVGLEDTEDLIADLEAGLSRLRAT